MRRQRAFMSNCRPPLWKATTEPYGARSGSRGRSWRSFTTSWWLFICCSYIMSCSYIRFDSSQKRVFRCACSCIRLHLQLTTTNGHNNSDHARFFHVQQMALGTVPYRSQPKKIDDRVGVATYRGTERGSGPVVSAAWLDARSVISRRAILARGLLRRCVSSSTYA